MSFYPEAKVYSDGSHYVAIPHSERKTKPRKRIEEERVTVTDKIKTEPIIGNFVEDEPINQDKKINEIKSVLKATEGVKVTKKELFDSFYKDTLTMTKKEKKSYLVEKMKPYFHTLEDTVEYVEINIQRKQRNMVDRRVRLNRKIALQNFNYFCTFTYNDKILTEETFKKKLKTGLRNYRHRYGWKYIGVWERSPEKNRLHFHGIFYIPEGTMPGELIEVNDYSFATKRRQITHQNTHFNKKLGRTDMEEIGSDEDMTKTVNYLLKYIEKSGERLVYSQGLPQFFISDISSKDVLCKFGIDDKKLLLHDDFDCWDEGEYIGKVSPDTIAKLRKAY